MNERCSARARASSRGASMIEVALAAAVLLFAVSAMLQLLILGLDRMRNADVQEQSQLAVSNTIADYQAMSYGAVVDAGLGTVPLADFIDEVGRRYTREATLTNIADGGLGARRVDVVVRWNNRVGALTVNRESRASFIVSEVPDASF